MKRLGPDRSLLVADARSAEPAYTEPRPELHQYRN